MMRLLIAEDEQDLAEALGAFFEKNQFTVDTVDNGQDAYDYAATGDYDAVILDVMMPKRNGIEVLRQLRADGVQTPIMMLTAASPVLMPAPTIIFPSLLLRMSCLPGCARCCAAVTAISRRSYATKIWPWTRQAGCFPAEIRKSG